jgi:SAM-dependent methyltransferase
VDNQDHHTLTNQAWWNEAAEVHAQGEGYQLKEFKAGMNKLHALERLEVGNVEGKKLLHLQCHFGMDTLSWARLGAQVTGVDYAEKAIAIARQLGQELALDATFVCCDVQHLPEKLDAQGAFDIVYSSYGAICWLPDLQPWGEVIAHYLKPGGFFYIADGHPFMWAMDEKAADFRLGYPYFSKEPVKDEIPGTYAEQDARLEHTTTYSWNHPLSEIFTALIAAGLTIDFFHEHPFCAWACLPEMERGDDRFQRFTDPGKREMLPLMFSLKATKR